MTKLIGYKQQEMKEKLRCKKCNSMMTYIVRREGVRRCRDCGHDEPWVRGE